MFNAPRPAQPYGSGSTNTFGGSFVDENPLANSVYDDGLDPWSTAPTPSPPPVPPAPSLFNSVIADATVPNIYHKAFAAVDPINSGDTSVNLLSRVLGTSSLPAATVDKIVNLVSSRPRVSKLEFFVALALVALAQGGKDVSIEQVAALASQNTLPEPTLHLESLPSSTLNAAALQFNRENGVSVTRPVPQTPSGFSSEDPWNTTRSSVPFGGSPGVTVATPTTSSGVTVIGTGLPINWWKTQNTVQVNLLGQQGFILNRYTVYEITSDRGSPVTRRYSEFVYLWDCLVRRYPFRLLPALPPKRIGADEHFLEQRKRGLARFLNFVINHPVIKEDGLLSVFLTHPSLETWRKQSSASLEEESTGKRVDRAEEMAIPSDLEEKLYVVRSKLGYLIDQWQKICILAERIIKRREAAAVRSPTFLRRAYLPTHFALPPFPPSSSAPPSPTLSVLSGFSFANLNPNPGNQADMSRLTNSFKVLVEVNQPLCWRGDGCELAGGVKQGLVNVSNHLQMQSDLLDQRTHVLLYTTLEALKSQRDLYLATYDLFYRHSRLSIDQVERLKQRVEINLAKLKAVKNARKSGWEDEREKIEQSVENDQVTIQNQLNRKIYIRACMWHELRVVLHNRENSLLSLAVKTFAREEHQFAQALADNWESLESAVDDMPVE